MPVAPRGVGQLRQEQPFPVAAKRALANDKLRRNLGHATSTIRAKRAAAVAEVVDWAELRASGAAIKDDVLANLGRYLVQLEEQVTERGGVVHWASDANEANRIVIGLVAAMGMGGDLLADAVRGSSEIAEVIVVTVGIVLLAAVVSSLVPLGRAWRHLSPPQR